MTSWYNSAWQGITGVKDVARCRKVLAIIPIYA